MTDSWETFFYPLSVHGALRCRIAISPLIEVALLACLLVARARIGRHVMYGRTPLGEARVAEAQPTLREQAGVRS